MAWETAHEIQVLQYEKLIIKLSGIKFQPT